MERTTHPKVTVVPAADGEAGLVECLMTAQDDPLLGNVSLPQVPSVAVARAWLHLTPWSVWLVLVDDVPAGVFSLHAPDLTVGGESLDDYLETDVYLLPEFRGQGLGAAAWEALEPSLPAGTRLVAEVWSRNEIALRWHRSNGWTHVGRYWWQSERDGDEDAGWCERFIRVVGSPAESTQGDEHGLSPLV